jgi:1-deoxy-D-xylulose-5-phosphate synthase
MPDGTGLLDFSKQFKNRFFDVGIAEQHGVTFAAGLAAGGYIPVIALYSTFLQRAYDQVLHDVCLQNLHVVFGVDRAGIVGEDGESHQGVFDAAYLSQVPKMNIYSPCFYDELERLITETAQNDELCAIRYPRGSENKNYNGDIYGYYTVVGSSGKRACVTYGRLFSNAVDAFLDSDIDIIKLNRIYPISDELVNILCRYETVCFFEEGIRSGGIAEHIGARLLEKGYGKEYKIFAIEDTFVPSATVGNALKKYGLDAESMRRAFE